jgi:hypothetical protein
MKHAFLVSAVLAVACSAVLAAVASAGSPRDFVAGGGEQSVADQDFNVSAHATKNGTEGQMTWRVGKDHVKADVTCLSVQGSQAAVGGIVTRSTRAANPVGSVLNFVMVDNGPHGSGPDLFNANRDENCAFEPAFLTPLTRGNLVVNDGS